MPRLLTRILALLAVAALVMGACGNDDDGEPDDPAPTTEATNGDEADDPDGTATEGGSDDPVEVPEFAGADTACEVLAGFSEFADRVDAVFDDLDGREADQALGVAEAAYARAGELESGELADDFALVSSAFAEFREILAEFGYDIEALEAAETEDPERFENTIIDSIEFAAAFGATAAYAEQECGLD